MPTLSHYLPQSVVDLAQRAFGESTPPALDVAKPFWFINHEFRGKQLCGSAHAAGASRRAAPDHPRFATWFMTPPFSAQNKALRLHELVERRVGLLIDFTAGERGSAAEGRLDVGADGSFDRNSELRVEVGNWVRSTDMDPSTPDGLVASQVALSLQSRPRGGSASHTLEREIEQLQVKTLLDGALCPPRIALAMVQRCAAFRQAQRDRPEAEAQTVAVVAHDRQTGLLLAGAERLYARWQEGRVTTVSAADHDIASILGELATGADAALVRPELAISLLALAEELLKQPLPPPAHQAP